MDATTLQQPTGFQPQPSGITPQPPQGGSVAAPPSIPLPPTPYTIVIDTREQLAYQFAQPLGFVNRRKKYRVATQVGTLPTGDYSLLHHERDVAIERKSLADLFSTLGQHRIRFTRELERLAAMRFAAVIVEAEWSTILTAPPRHSRMNPTAIIASIMAWTVRYPTIHWVNVPGRAMGEVVTLRLLDRWWRTNVEPVVEAVSKERQVAP